MRKKGRFTRFAEYITYLTGKPAAFLIALLTIAVWAITGPMYDFSDTWQIVINTATTIVTFLMVFLIQNTQNRDSVALQLKLDELIRATKGAHTVLLDLEELNDAELASIRKTYAEIAAHAREQMRKGEDDTDIPEVLLEKDIL
jgi:low affinity Fe/Cu permease